MSIDYGHDITEEPLVTKTLLGEDLRSEVSLRPHSLEEYVGQQKAKNLRIFIEAAKRRTEPLDHVLLHGLRASGNDAGRDYRCGNGR